jgi:probable rRNA maturation factor
MSKVYIGYDKFGLVGVDDEFIQFVFDVVVSMAKLNPDAEAGVVLATDETMQKLNMQYRGKDKSTNVLSFGYLETAQGDAIPAEDKNYLGDIYMSHQLITSESKDLEITPKERFAQLMVHGLLHLSGMHHDTPKQASKMEDLEDQILATLQGVE